MEELLMKEAVAYCVEKGWGYYSDLVEKLCQKMVDELHQVGFLKTGFTRDKRTLKALKLAETYKRELNW